MKCEPCPCSAAFGIARRRSFGSQFKGGGEFDVLAKNAKNQIVSMLLKQSHGVVPRTRHKGALAREHTRLSARLCCEMHSALA